MQKTSNGYFDITITNKYDSSYTGRKERNHSIAAFLMTIVICSAILIFSKKVSSTSEASNKAVENIKGENQKIFPTPTPEAKRLSAGMPVIASTTSSDGSKMMFTIMSNLNASSKIVRDADNISENQNVTGSAIKVESDLKLVNYTSEKKSEEVLLTPSSSSDTNKKTLTNEEKKLRKEEKRKAKIKKEREKAKKMKLHVNTGLGGSMQRNADYIANICMENWKKKGVLPSVAVGQAMIESTLGKHCRGYNLWGIKSGAVRYGSLYEGTHAYLKVINNGYYKGAPGVKNWSTQIRRILAGGYCQPVGDYYSNISRAVRLYNLDEYDKQMFIILKKRGIKT